MGEWQAPSLPKPRGWKPPPKELALIIEQRAEASMLGGVGWFHGPSSQNFAKLGDATATVPREKLRMGNEYRPSVVSSICKYRVLRPVRRLISGQTCSFFLALLAELDRMEYFLLSVFIIIVVCRKKKIYCRA